MTRYSGAILLALIWVAVTGSPTLPNAVFGLLVGALCLYLVRERVASPFGVARLGSVAALSVIFVREVIVSAWRVAVLVMSPQIHLKPGILVYPLTVQRDFEITLLANLITLTPGTLTVDVSDDRTSLFVHALDCSSPQKTCLEIEQTFERRILRAFAK